MTTYAFRAAWRAANASRIPFLRRYRAWWSRSPIGRAAVAVATVVGMFFGAAPIAGSVVGAQLDAQARLAQLPICGRAHRSECIAPIGDLRSAVTPLGGLRPCGWLRRTGCVVVRRPAR